jgi:release factor glutamine methyltransferase
MKMALEHLIREATVRLDAAGVPAPETEAGRLAAVALGIRAEDLNDRTDVGPVAAQFVELVRQRSRRIPLPRLVGRAPFRNIELLVGDGVFVPQPETGPVVEWAVKALGQQGLDHPLVVDLCSGSGVIPLAIANEAPHAVVHGVELDPTAYGWASRNVEARIAAGDTPVTLHLGDIADAVHELDGTVDMVVSNPPYVADHEVADVEPEVRDHDPRVAIEGGADGLVLIRLVEQVARRLLRDGGLLVIEHSDRQGKSAPAILKAAGGWTYIKAHRDDDGLDRFVTARWRPRT